KAPLLFRAARDDITIQGGVAACPSSPSYIRALAIVLQPAQGLLVVPQDVGSAEGVSESFGRDWLKREAGRGATGDVGLFHVNDGIRKAADLRCDRDRDISQR